MIATSAMELAVKVVLLKPIVFGLVHIEVLAGFITDLATKHTGMDRFNNFLTAILAQFGGVDLKSFTRPGSTKTLSKEMEDVQALRNGAIHRGDVVSTASATLAVAVATTLLKEIFPQVLAKLNLHQHDPGVVCGKAHGVTVPVYFHIPGRTPSLSGYVFLDIEPFDPDNVPATVSGKLSDNFPPEEAATLRSIQPCVPMWVAYTSIQYEIRFLPDANEFTGRRVE